jgi:hypothetical protein
MSALRPSQWAIIVSVAIALTLGVAWGLPSPARVAVLFYGASPDSLAGPLDASSAGYFSTRENIDAIAIANLRAGMPVIPYEAPPLPKVLDLGDKLAIARRYLTGSCSADERQAYVPLARMDPLHGDLNPRGSPYGGAFLYPLGAFLLLLRAASVLHLSPHVSHYIAVPRDIRDMYIAGRLFSLLPFLAILILLALFGAAIGKPRVGTIAMLTWALSSMPQNQALVTKPHVWAAFWVLLGVFLLFRSTGGLRPRRSVLLSACCLGIAAGSSAPTLIMLLLIPLLFYRDGRITGRVLVSALLLSGFTVLVTNPYVVLTPAQYLVTLLHYGSATGYGYAMPGMRKSLAATRDMFVRGFAFPLGIIGGLALLRTVTTGGRFWSRLAIVWIAGFVALAVFTGETRYGLFLGPILCLYVGRGLDWMLARPRFERHWAGRLALTGFFCPGALLSALFLSSVVFSGNWEEPTRSWVTTAHLEQATSIALLGHPEPETLPPLPFFACNLVDLDQMEADGSLPALVVVGNSPQQRVRWEAHTLRRRYILSSKVGLSSTGDWLLSIRMRSASRATAWVFNLKQE